MNESQESVDNQSVWLRMADWLIDGRFVCFGCLCCLLPIAWIGSARLQFERSIETMFSAEDPVLLQYRFLKENFGGNEVILVVYDDADAWSEPGMQQIDDFANALRQVEGVQAVTDLAQLNRLIESLNNLNPSGLFQVRSQRPGLLEDDSNLATEMADLFEGYTHSADKQTVAIACLMDPSPAAARYREEHIASIRRLIAGSEMPIANARLVGESVLVHDGFDMVTRDGVRLGWTSSIGLALLLLIGFRSLRWTLIALAVVWSSLMVTNGSLYFLGLQLTMVSSMLTGIVAVIGFATTIHWLLAYQQAIDQGMQVVDACRSALRRLIRPIVFACLTDAVGFAALMFSNVGPVQDYGLMMCLASLIVLLVVLTLVPTAVCFGSRLRYMRHLPGEIVVRAFLARSLDWVQKNRQRFIAAIFALVTFSVVGVSMTSVETDFIRNFRESSDIATAYEIVEDRLGGAGVWDCLLPVPETIDATYMNMILELEDRLRGLRVEQDTGDDLQLSKVMSCFDAMKAADASRLVAALPLSIKMAAMRLQMPEMMDSMVMAGPNSRGERFARIMLRSSERVPADAKQELIASVQREVASFCKSEQWRSQFEIQGSESSSESLTTATTPKVTGYYRLLTQLVLSLLADQWLCFAIASVAIYCMLAVALGSPRLALIGVLPNVLPPVMVLGCLGFLGIRINMGIAMIAAVSIGMSIDSSLHYIMRYQQEIARSGNAKKALKRTHSDVGLAISLATLGLVIGFGALGGSEFLPTVAFGFAAALTMIGGLVGNLWLLPTFLSRYSSLTVTKT